MTTIQIVEDDRTLNNGIAMTLSGNERCFVQSFSLANARDGYQKNGADLVVLDINLPDGSGYEYLKWLRERSDVPVLILTANDLEIDEVMSLEMGADDYISKPFSLAVLRARAEALLRRKRADKDTVYREGPFLFDFDKRIFKCGEHDMQLSQTEQVLLKIFTSNPGQLLTRDLLIDRIWDHKGEFVDENALSVTIGRLRKKLFTGEIENRIETVYGQGYRWRREPDDADR